MIKKFRSSLTAKIFLLVSFLLILISTIVCLGIIRFMPTTYKNQLTEGLDAASQELVHEMQHCDSLTEALDLLPNFETSYQASVVILDSSGDTIYPQEATLQESYANDTSTSDCAMQEHGMGSTAVAESTDDVAENAVESAQAYEEDTMTAMKSYDTQIGHEKYTVSVTGSTQAVNQAVQVLKEIFPFIAILVILLSLLFSWFASRYLTKPIVRMSRISRKMAGLDFKDRCEEKRTDEVGTLGKSLNELSSNLSLTLDELKQANEILKSDMEKELVFFSAVSHELKTPVTILKGHLGGMLQKVGAYQDRDYYLQRSLEVTATMEGMVQEILTVSRMSSFGNDLPKENTDLAEQVRLQLADLNELMELKGLQLNLDIPEHLTAMVNPGLMEKVFRNLITNAVRYTPERGSIRIFLHQDKTSVRCRVENTGAQIPLDALPKLFDAFYRVESSRNRKTGGSGLGLYIAKMALELHHGQLGVQNIEDGVQFYFLLPQ